MINNDSILMQMLGTKMRYTSQRQGVLAQNIANVDTPAYKAQDMKKLDFSKLASSAATKLMMNTTSNKHLSGLQSKPGNFAIMDDRTTMEINPTGNNVTLEDQMAKLSDTGAEFQISQSLYKKFTGMYRMALGNH